MGPNEVRGRTGLSRDQQRYCEEKGYLGQVQRNGGGERAFHPDQVRFFERLADLRAGGLNLEEAAALAAESAGGAVPKVESERLEVLMTRSMAEAERSLRAALVLWQLARTRGTAKSEGAATGGRRDP